jgi:chromosome segregation ATPase
MLSNSFQQVFRARAAGLALLFVALSTPLGAQSRVKKAAARDPAPEAVQPAPIRTADASDKFGGLRETADRLRAIYERLDKDNLAKIDALVKSKRCKMPQVEPLLSQVEDGLGLWNDAEAKYWTSWVQSEELRVESQQKSLADMEAEQKRAEDLVTSTRNDREELMRNKANLEKDGQRTEEIRKQIDSLIQDIKDSEARLADAQKNYEDVTTRVRAMQASINAKLVEYRQNKLSVEAFGAQMRDTYQKTRAEAEEICK